MGPIVTQSTLDLAAGADAAELRRASEWLAERGAKYKIPQEHLARLDLCLNEALANVMEHGQPAQSADIQLALAVARHPGSSEATVTVMDSGTAFDPLTFVPRDNPRSLAEADLGGLGIVMIRNFADDLRYENRDGRNHLSFSVRWEAKPPRSVGESTGKFFARTLERRRKNVKPLVERRRGLGDRRSMGLEWLSLFHGTDEAAIRKVIQKCEVQELVPGDILLQPSVPNDNVFMLLSGRLAAYIDTELDLNGDLDPASAIPIEAGQCIGELSAIDGKAVTAHIIALTNVRVLKLTQELFWHDLMAIPGVARNMLVAISQRMRSANEAMLDHQRKQMHMQHLQKELQVARELQASMLPHRPMFPDRKDIEVAASMESASEVGGDLFDAFFVDERHLFLCIGDVAGHGIPAAMFMARIIGLMRFIAIGTPQPDKLLEKLNDQLCPGNDSSLFVTLFCGFLNVESGRLVYSNGGHCAPVLLRGNEASRLPIPKGTLVGAIPDLNFSANEIMLEPGDMLACYTDGMTEAQTVAGEEFSENRLLDALRRASGLAPEAAIDMVRHAVAEFTDNRELTDDHTMLALRWQPGAFTQQAAPLD